MPPHAGMEEVEACDRPRPTLWAVLGPCPGYSFRLFSDSSGVPGPKGPETLWGAGPIASRGYSRDAMNVNDVAMLLMHLQDVGCIFDAINVTNAPDVAMLSMHACVDASSRCWMHLRCYRCHRCSSTVDVHQVVWP